MCYSVCVKVRDGAFAWRCWRCVTARLRGGACGGAGGDAMCATLCVCESA